ncbi:DUF3732 domain-containing protein [Streptomyces sp. NRRL B-24484]|uniref:DUF3732 domain-containing protein n=1 Tax=Streptomyces sp. NRRL B-24484 TaxID=1463833 RepID=UPI0004C27240|nr:DUF3732 domain-containing protein [Streptomyces sp. NRRL B-24484]
MQIRSVVLYSKSGKIRELTFRLGELNIVTGSSKTGKSILLDIVDFCLGRDDAPVAVDPLTQTVAWCAVLFQLPDTRAFVARPMPGKGQKEVKTAMLELGTDLEPLPYRRLEKNHTSDEVRQQLGRRIGIGDVRSEPRPGSITPPFAVNLGHAALLCLQNQDEVTTRRILFHRQSDSQVAEGLRATLPYFLGAVGDDQAAKQQELVGARRVLRRKKTDLSVAEAADRDIDRRLHYMLAQAQAAGLIPADEQFDSREVAMQTLHDVVERPRSTPGDSDTAARSAELEARRSNLRDQLRQVTDQQQLLVRQEKEETTYTQVVARGISRLHAVDLLPAEAPADGHGTCPMCGSRLEHADTTVQELHDTLNELRGQLSSVHTVQPRRRQALDQLTAAADQLREELRGVEGALLSLAEIDADHARFRAQTEQQAFLRGSIDAHLKELRLATGDGNLAQLRSAVALAERLVSELQADLNSDEVADRLEHALNAISGSMTDWARDLNLSHSDRRIRLDIRNLTVLADTDDDVKPLLRIGSGENWVGYHLVAHLALHRYFTLNHRPVPRLLFLDQITQPFYPSDVAKETGAPTDQATDTDRDAVRGMFKLMHDFVTGLAPNFQLIISDHANLPDPWFQQCVRHNWRNGDALIPQEWIREHA